MKKISLTRTEGILILITVLLLGFVIGLWTDQAFENSLQQKLNRIGIMIETIEKNKTCSYDSSIV